ncbi:uncharacterized protein STEHIDRAFT_106687 [Stereum hirsutum FP-91666 SS1]|uniref:uncharacterized protein n=1 Tax=Stereum hirsutum (strain FP-91666) TaxID=721885 RepID=UPI000440F2A4|nr:uncharacterized protein STEHIDRAFT_106687 [Stereum hirsutum FP-91666 SS1]EIM92057.1 hypothetical protein STEHIDRAFT_106687 [Stereum hirsutum FP-91666 SS1]
MTQVLADATERMYDVAPTFHISIQYSTHANPRLNNFVRIPLEHVRDRPLGGKRHGKNPEQEGPFRNNAPIDTHREKMIVDLDNQRPRKGGLRGHIMVRCSYFKIQISPSHLATRCVRDKPIQGGRGVKRLEGQPVTSPTLPSVNNAGDETECLAVELEVFWFLPVGRARFTSMNDTRAFAGRRKELRMLGAGTSQRHRGIGRKMRNGSPNAATFDTQDKQGVHSRMPTFVTRLPRLFTAAHALLTKISRLERGCGQ